MKSIQLTQKSVQARDWPSHLLNHNPAHGGEVPPAAGGLEALRAERDRLRVERDQLQAERNVLLAASNQFTPVWKQTLAGRNGQFQEMQASFEVLERKQNHYANLYDFAPIGYVILESGGRITDINKAGARLLGWEHARLLGRFFADFVAAGDASKFLRHLQLCQRGATRVATELLLQCKDGVVLAVELISAPFESLEEQVTQYRTAIIDITSRRRAERGLEQLQQDYRTLVNALDGIVWEGVASGGDWRFTFVSNQAERLLGYPANRWINEAGFWLQLIHPEDRAHILEARAHALAAGCNYLIEYRMLTADRQVLWLRDNVTVTRQPSGQAKFQGVTVNITEVKEAEQVMRSAYHELEDRVLQRTAALTHTCRELEQSIEDRQRLENEILELAERERRRIGMDLHDELGQRLAGLSLMVKGLQVKLGKKDLPEAAQAGQILDMVSQTMHQTRDLSHDLAALEADTEPLPAALGALTRRATTLFGIGCQLRARQPIPPLGQNVVRHLCKIVQEAITNAIKHGRAKKILVRLAVVDRRIQLMVSNDGKPFPKLLRSHDGLGLRTMRYRANIIGADLEVRAKGARGTVVSCSFPIPPAAPET